MDTPTSLPSTPIDLAQAFGIDPRRTAPGDAAQAATLAQEFEAMLMLQMVRQMRQSLLSEEDQEQGLGNDRWTETFDVEYARYLTEKGGGVGLADFIRSQLDAKAASQSPAAGAPGSTALGTAGAGEPRTSDRPSVVPLAIPSPVPVAIPAAIPAAHPTAAPSAAPLAAPVGARAGEAEAAHNAGVDNVAEDDDGLQLPLDAATTSKFGWRGDPFHGQRRFHSGVDLRAAYGTEVPAAGAGRVTFAGERGGYGTLVVVQHADGMETRYAHLSAAGVKEGDRVDSGQVIGRVGSSGRSTAPHLHFEVRINGARVDPELVASRNPEQFKFVRTVVD